MSTTVETDVNQVVAVATDYLTSFYSGTAEERSARIAGALHAQLAKRSPAFVREDGTFREIPFDRMIQLAAETVNIERTVPYSVKVLDMTPRMASVRTDADWGVDFMHLVKVDGVWKVVNVLWDKP